MPPGPPRPHSLNGDLVVGKLRTLSLVPRPKSTSSTNGHLSRAQSWPLSEIKNDLFKFWAISSVPKSWPLSAICQPLRAEGWPLSKFKNDLWIQWAISSVVWFDSFSSGPSFPWSKLTLSTSGHLCRARSWPAFEPRKDPPPSNGPSVPCPKLTSAGSQAFSSPSLR